jgi:hypothetical protein
LPADKNLPREPEFFTTFRFGQYDISDFTKPQIFQKIKSYGFDTAVLELDAQSVSDAVIMRTIIKQARENGIKIMAEWKIKNENDFENVKKQISQMQIGKNSLDGIKFDISQLSRTKQKEAAEEIIKIKESFAQNSVFAVSGSYYDRKSFEEGGLLRVYKVSHNDESLLQEALGDEGRVFIEFSTDGKNYDTNLTDYAKVERDVSEIAWAKTSGPVGVEFNVVSNMEKMANSRGSAEQLLNNIAKTKKDLNYLIPNDDEPLLTGRARHKNIENGRKYFEAEERRQAYANIGGSIAYFQKVLDFNDINANERALRDLKDFLISIDAWDNPVNRASMVYVIKHKMRVFARTNYGVFFESENGKTLNFNINPEGKFHANEDFVSKMEKLLRLRVFADMDGNLARFTEEFSDETKEIFSELALYGTGVPSVITGNRKQSLDVRFSKVSEILKEKMVFYTETGARRWVWDERIKDFKEDAAYKEKLDLSISPLRDYVRQTVKNLDYDFDGLYAVFVKAADGIDNYYQTAQAALKAMAYNDDLFGIILRQTQTANLDALIGKWQTFAPKDVDNVLDALEAKFINSSLQKDETAYMDLLKIVSMLEYCRLSFSENPLDAGNKRVVLNQEIKRQILQGTYKKFNADNETSVHLSPLRHTDINTRIASFYQKKLAGAGLSVRASGMVTINIQKTGNRKDQTLLYAIEGGVNAQDIVYSGDEMLFEGAQESSAGNDDDIAKFALQKYPEITVINSSLKKHDSKKRPNVIDSSSALSRNAVKPADSVESSMFVHKILLDRLEFNIGALAENEYFQPENLAQSLKEILQTGYLDKDGNETKIILPGQVIERQSGITFDEKKQIEMTLETRDFILKNYDIEKIYTIKLMTTGINNLSIVFRLYTDKGDFIFKALTRDLYNARFIVNFQNTIYKKGLQVPQLVRLKLAKNIDKDNVLIQKDGVYFVLETSLPAGISTHPKEADFRHYEEFATYNALIDNIAHSKDYHEQGTAPKRPEIYDMVIQTEQEYIKLKENIDAKPQKSEADLIALENFDFIMEQIRIFKENFSDEIQNSLVQSVSSFDIAFNNVFFDEETKNAAGVFDFGGTSVAARVLAFDYMFSGIYGPFYKEFSYKYNGYDIIRKSYKEYNKIVNLKLTPQELTGALEISRGRFIYNIVNRRMINQNYGANIFSHPEMIDYAQDNIAQFKKFASDFDAENTDAFIKYVLYDNPKLSVGKHTKIPLIKTEKSILSAI